MKEYTSDIELPKGMLKWLIAFLVAVFVGAGAIVIYPIVKERALQRELSQRATAASWSGDSVTNWPRLVLLQRAEFKHHSPMSLSCSSLIQLPKGEVVALTAGYLLGEAGGVTPGFLNGLGGLAPLKLRALDKEIVNWELYVGQRNSDKVQVEGLFGEVASYDECDDQLLLRLAPRTNGWPATPMMLRFTPVEPGEPLYLIGYTHDGDSLKQVVHRASRVADTAGLVCQLAEPANLTAHSGAPIVDQHGLVVGVMAGGVLLDKADDHGRIHMFRGRSVTTLLPVLAGTSRP
jgi:hypothetical protein